jgi:hypothetical protein
MCGRFGGEFLDGISKMLIGNIFERKLEYLMNQLLLPMLTDF